MNADAALREHGLSGERLLGLARRCANNACARLPYAPPGLQDDLTSYLVEVGLRQALLYDVARSGDGYTFPSYVYDVMAQRVVDFFRRKSEGFGDKRHNCHNRISLAADPLQDFAGVAVEDDPLEPDARMAAMQLADELELTPASRRTLLLVVAPLSEGCPPWAAAEEAGVDRPGLDAMLAALRQELAEHGYADRAG